MVYVPIPPSASPRARALAKELQETIAEHRRRNPEMEDADVRAALRMTTPSGKSNADAGAKWVALALGLAVMFGLVGWLVTSAR